MPRAKKQTVQKVVNPQLDLNFLLLLVSSIIMLGLVGIVLSPAKPQKTSTEVLSSVENALNIAKPKPKLKEGAVIPQFSAKGVYVFDYSTGEVLFAKQENSPLLPASTTKIATALVAMNHYQPEQVLEVTTLKGAYGSSMGLQIGEKITANDLLHGLLIHSANDAAYVLADNYPGGREGFITAMNQLAQTHNLENTHFTNPVGFDEYLHFSTARDLSLLASQAMQSPTFAQIVAMQSYDASSIDGKTKHKLATTNQLLGKVDGVVGVKTGHTATSGESLITLVDRGDRKILFAVIGSQDRFGETKMLIDWIYENYSWGEEVTTGDGTGVAPE